MRALLAVLLLGSLACGAALATKDIVAADVALEAARAAGAEKSAPYEYTAAEAYLHEARVKAGRAQYEPAKDFADKAQDLAGRAKAKALAAAGKPAEAN